MRDPTLILIALLALAGCKKSEPPGTPAKIERITACQAYHRCCVAYVDALAAFGGVDDSLIAKVRKGCQSLESLVDLPHAQKECMQALGILQSGFPALEEKGFPVPAECRFEDIEIEDPPDLAPPDEIVDAPPEDAPPDEEKKWADLAADLEKRAAAEPDLVIGGATVTSGLCSTTSTVLPLSRSCSSSSFIRWMSWGCSPIVGSSKT